MIRTVEEKKEERDVRGTSESESGRRASEREKMRRTGSEDGEQIQICPDLWPGQKQNNLPTPNVVPMYPPDRLILSHRDIVDAS